MQKWEYLQFWDSGEKIGMSSNAVELEKMSKDLPFLKVTKDQWGWIVVELKQEKLPHLNIILMDYLGSNGWEAYAATAHDSNSTVKHYLKRLVTG